MDVGHYVGFASGLLGLGVAVVALWRLVSAAKVNSELTIACDENADAAKEQQLRAQRAEESLLRMTAWADSLEKELRDAELDSDVVTNADGAARYHLDRLLRKREERPDRATSGVGTSPVPIGFAAAGAQRRKPGPVSD